MDDSTWRVPALRRIGAERRAAIFALALLGASAPFGGRLSSQSSARGSSKAAAAQERSAELARTTLDGWIVTRFRGAQLLDDSTAMRPRGTDSSAKPATTIYPRVESVRESATGDTLLALHFGTQAGLVPLRDLATVRLSASSGAITAQEARIVTRRAFRAPRLPKARYDDAAAWRYGWAYVLVTRARRPSQGFRGWLLLTLPDSVPVRTPSRTPVRRPSTAKLRTR